MATRGKELIQAMEQYAPSRLAMEKDRIGLQVGDPNSEVKGVLVTLDVNEEVVDEAIRLGANWIIAHHAVIYQPLKALRTDEPAGRMFAKLLQHGMQVYIAHTNLDATDDGVNDVLVEKLQLKDTELLIPYGERKLKKLVVFVPIEHQEAVRQAMSEAGAGWIGNYSHCTFNVQGEGTFLPQAGTQPFIGQAGKLERVQEVRIETVVDEARQSRVIAAMLAVHPYEEVAYDLYPLDRAGEPIGMGKIGALEQAILLEEFARRVREVYQLDGLRMVGDPTKMVQRVAILGGSGGRYIAEAKRKGADVYLTGDIDYHVAQDALAEGLCLIDPGHHVEHWVVERVCQKLRQAMDIPIHASQVNTNPFRFLPDRSN